LYSVRDTLLSVVRDRPEALILDFFAGSGTTLHATALINADDGGRRRCILVSNNEVDAKTASELVSRNILPGDPEFEKRGIFWQATWPRCEAAVTGTTPSGRLVPGKYANGLPHSSGFAENVEFFELAYLDKDQIQLGTQFQAIEPTLWLSAGAVGTLPRSTENERYVLNDQSNYGVLFERSAFRTFNQALSQKTNITHVFLVTDSVPDYTEMCSRLPSEIGSSMLYRDYLANFRINTGEAYR
jgi:adenine-specific DNA-methyltransferase